MQEEGSMALLEEFVAWAWARHHNKLSWYVRPLFFLPYAYSAYHHSTVGIVTTIIALGTSMFWFPAPEHPTQDVIDALQAEKDYLLGEWNACKVLLALLPVVVFTALGAAFWRRSFTWGLIIINGSVVFKLGWTLMVFRTRESIVSHLIAALVGLLLCNAMMGGALYYYYRPSEAVGGDVRWNEKKTR